MLSIDKRRLLQKRRDAQLRALKRWSARTLLIHFAGRQNHSNVNMSEWEAGHWACAAGALRHRFAELLDVCFPGWWSSFKIIVILCRYFGAWQQSCSSPLVRVWSEIWPGDPLTSVWTTNITVTCTAISIKIVPGVITRSSITWKTKKMLDAQASHSSLFRLVMSWSPSKHQQFALYLPKNSIKPA